jgi:hypothetical protein
MKEILNELGVSCNWDDASGGIERCLFDIAESKTFQEFLEQEKQAIFDALGPLNEELAHLQRKREQFFFQDLVCPITQEVMRNPAMIESGISYEHSAISSWLEKKSICPTTNIAVDKKIIIKEIRLKAFCDRYWELFEKCEKMNQEIDENNQALDLLNHFNEKVLAAYEDPKDCVGTFCMK